MLRLAVSVTVAACVVRLVVLFVTPLELHPDEAQYWLWSRTLDLGYFSKPPLIAWIIAATTGIGGDSESWVRLGGPLLHAAAGLLLFFVGRRLYSPAAGLLACGLYTLMPGVQLSSLVISTDAPLLALLSAALLVYASLPAQADRTGPGRAAMLGGLIGAAALAKYAAIYAVMGIVLHLLVDRQARRLWTLPMAAAATGAFGLALAPNLIWNALHRFATLSHTVENANLDGSSLFNPGEMGEFILTQPGVFGPVAFGALIAGLIIHRVRGLTAQDRMLLCWIAPPLIIVTVQALLSRANANWAAAAYPAAAVLVAAWLLRWRARGWIIAALASQAAIALVFVLCVTRPDIANQIGAANSLKRSRGWDATVSALVERAREEQGGGRLSAVAVDDRFLFNAAAYYGRDYFGRLGAPPLTMWVRQIRPNNQAEAEAPLAVDQGRRVLAASYEGWFAKEMAADFGSVSGEEVLRIWLDPDNNRRVELFVGEGFAPLPRDPQTGLPPGATR
jgi:4-amino-4-deoxy-L-arabinose transferase-like glycosyltransferase